MRVSHGRKMPQELVSPGEAQGTQVSCAQKKQMKSRWKRVLVWSSLGGLAVGTAIALAKRARTPQGELLDYQRIPAGCQRLSLWTEQFQAEEGGSDLAVQDKYVLQLTPFKIWSVFEFSGQPGGTHQEGAAIYHITYLRYAGDALGGGYPDEGRLQDRFYGTIDTVSAEGRRGERNHIARGGILEIRKCLVGGASNGVETGEVHRSAAPVLHYRFEYSAR